MVISRFFVTRCFELAEMQCQAHHYLSSSRSIILKLNRDGLLIAHSDVARMLRR